MSVLPPELEREIFEAAARSDLKNAPLKLNLSLVARRFHFWVDLVFYELVKITSESNADKFLNLITLKPPGFFANAVKALCLVYRIKPEQAHAIISACTGVQQLACWVNQTNAPQHLPLRYLSIEFRHFLNILPTSAWLSSLTHLHLVFWAFQPGVENEQLARLNLSRALPALPRLTHLANHSRMANPTYAKAVCASCPALEIFIIVNNTMSENATVSDSYSFDDRIAVIDLHEVAEVADDWEDAYFGRASMWNRAEDIIRERNGFGAPRTTVHPLLMDPMLNPWQT
ncbi:hypothetical protein C8R43DRAFT_165615 [Mycena crocata]|nr:hypothetical protein C8R43DRAFT_165615 [Mycena crocata]